MAAKIIIITLMILASVSSVSAETGLMETRRNMGTDHDAEAYQAAGAVPAVERRQGLIKRRLIIIC